MTNGLAGVVACLWRNETTAAREQRVLPDGCMNLIWMDGVMHVTGLDSQVFLATVRPDRWSLACGFVPAPPRRARGARVCAARPAGPPRGSLVWHDGLPADRRGVTLAAAVASRATELDPALGMVLACLRAGSSVAATADALGWTDRTLHRRCRDAFGYGPSVLRRILRFRMALQLAGRGMPVAATAVWAGYSDQAHLACEVRALAGVPLGQLVRAG